MEEEQIGRSKRWAVESAAIAAWINSQDCRWVPMTLRAESVLQTPEQWSKTGQALDWTLDAVQRRVNSIPSRLKGQILGFVPFVGGDEGRAVHPHIHCLIEFPKRLGRDEFKSLVEKSWNCFLRKCHGFEVEARVWMSDADYDASNNNLISYYVRPEGSTSSWGFEKVLWEYARRRDVPVLS